MSPMIYLKLWFSFMILSKRWNLANKYHLFYLKGNQQERKVI